MPTIASFIQFSIKQVCPCICSSDISSPFWLSNPNRSMIPRVVELFPPTGKHRFYVYQCGFYISRYSEKIIVKEMSFSCSKGISSLFSSFLLCFISSFKWAYEQWTSPSMLLQGKRIQPHLAAETSNGQESALARSCQHWVPHSQGTEDTVILRLDCSKSSTSWTSQLLSPVFT